MRNGQAPLARAADNAMTMPSPVHNAGEEHLYLVAGVPFEQYRDFLLKEVPDNDPNRLERIAADWQRAALHFGQLRSSEAAWADHPQILPIPKELEPLLARVRGDLMFPKAFTLPVEFGLVELDRLVVRQELINLVQVERLKQKLGPKPSPEDVFRMCLPLDHAVAKHGVRVDSPDTFVFASDSNDLRFLESALLRLDQVQGVQSLGPIVGIIGIVIGYSSNYLNAISAEGRLVLHNGSHRAFALRNLGVSHVPCVIQKADSRQELGTGAVGGLRRNPDYYLKEPRPPALKDFENPFLCQRWRLVPIERHVKVRFSVETYDVIKN
jgi:hypothetical protein